MTFGLQIGVFGFKDTIVIPGKKHRMQCMFNRLQSALTPIKLFFKEFIYKLVSYTNDASYVVALDHASKQIEDTKKHLGSKSGMYVKCFIHVLPQCLSNCHRIHRVDGSCYLRSEITES